MSGFGTASLGFVAADDGCRTAPLPARYAAIDRTTDRDVDQYAITLRDLRFMRWATEQDEFPTRDQVVERFTCSPAMATAWLEALADVYDVEQPGP